MEWNLLSSVSPALISWQCASKHFVKLLTQYLMKREKNLLKTVAALLTGSLKEKKKLLPMLNDNKIRVNYLKKSSQPYNMDINCKLIQILHLHLLNNSGELNADLELKHVPEIKSIKRGINGVLNEWSTNLIINEMNEIFNKNNQFTETLSNQSSNDESNFDASIIGGGVDDQKQKQADFIDSTADFNVNNGKIETLK
jgi:hypothetical protein